MAVLTNFIDGDSSAKTCYVGVLACALITTPSMIGSSKFRDVLITQLAVNAVD